MESCLAMENKGLSARVFRAIHSAHILDAAMRISAQKGRWQEACPMSG